MADTLAWHETLEIHELVAFQSNALMDLKMSIKKIQDSELKQLYADSIQALENNLKELIPFYNFAPEVRGEERNNDPFYAGNILGMSKTAVRNYAAAITETATPELRNVFKNHLNNAVDWHANVFNYIYKKGLYPAYDLKQLLQNDVNNATKALQMPYK
ncbi:spore coat protein [Bacillus sp. AGMB 02131]|uniref:Spore coat protein n=1 Tax=Peribacillus faecalis TaxID=2772559 RepID=A0A927CZY6_9BACI|nr:spore coat protein [Peribacillus faecalis]